jgi:hypothetical protein
LKIGFSDVLLSRRSVGLKVFDQVDGLIPPGSNYAGFGLLRQSLTQGMISGQPDDGLGEGVGVGHIDGEAAAAGRVFSGGAGVGTDAGAAVPDAFQDRQSESFEE